MKIVLTTLNSKYIHPNLALRILKNDLLNHQLECDLIEYSIKHDLNEIVFELKDYDIIGLSCYIFNIEAIKKLTFLIKQANPKAIIVLGGPEVSYFSEQDAQAIAFDYIVCGEGEQIFVELLNNIINNNEIDNQYLIINNKQTITLNRAIHQVTPSYFYALTNDITNIDLENQLVYLETSRGCPYGCYYCLASLDNKIRDIPLDMIFTKLAYLLAHKAKIVKFLDRTFNFNVIRTNQILNYLIENDNGFTTFQFEITGELLDESSIDLINQRARVGLFRFEIGIQSTNDFANKAIGRYQNFASLKKVIERINQGKKVVLHLDLIAGLPYEDLESFRQTFNDVYHLNGLELQLGILKLLKGTKMNNLVVEHNYVFEKTAPYELIENKYLSKSDLDKIEYVEKGLNNFYNQQKAKQLVRYLLKNKKINPFDLFYQLGKIVSENNNQIYDLYYAILHSSLINNQEDLIILFNNYYDINKLRAKSLTKISNKKDVLHQFIKKYGLVQNEVFSHSIVEQINNSTYFIRDMKTNKNYIMKIN